MSSNLNSNSVTTTSLGVNNTSPSYPLHVTGGSTQLGTLLFSFTNTTSTSVRGQIAMNDSSRTMSFQNNGQDAFSINSSGQTTFVNAMLNYVTSAANTSSVSVNPFVTFPSAGVYMLLISQCSGTSSQTPELIDNLCKLFVVICSTASGQAAQVITLYNPNNGWFSISNISQLSIGLTVSAGSYTYRAFYQKIF